MNPKPWQKKYVHPYKWDIKPKYWAPNEPNMHLKLITKGFDPSPFSSDQFYGKTIKLIPSPFENRIDRKSKGWFSYYQTGENNKTDTNNN